MTRITSRETVLLLLQEQLAKLAADRRSAGSTSAAVAPGESPPLKRLRRTIDTEGVAEGDRARVLVRSLLLDATDERLGADPRFEALAESVTRIIREMDGGEALLAAAFASLVSRSD